MTLGLLRLLDHPPPPHPHTHPHLLPTHPWELSLLNWQVWNDASQLDEDAFRLKLGAEVVTQDLLENNLR